MSSQTPWQGRKVLVVDDSKTIREKLKDYYLDIGFKECEFSSNGLEALDLIKKRDDIDLVSLDIIMPIMHGIECYFKIKEIKPDLKIVFISCLASDPSFRDSIRDKIADNIMLGKPLSKGALLVTIKNIYGISEQGSQALSSTTEENIPPEDEHKSKDSSSFVDTTKE
jgi:two-component system, chemotaxis family, chemotaxis protein CheY